MKPLSLEHVNTVSPYFVESTNNIGFYQFFTETGVPYSVG